MITPQQAQEISRMMEGAGIPLHVWLPIMHLESGGNPQAHNPRGEDSRGLFQINMDTAPRDLRDVNLFDPLVNAWAILRGRDWFGHPDRLEDMQKIEDPGQQAEFMWRHGIRPYWRLAQHRNIRYYATEGLQGLKKRYGLLEPVSTQTNQVTTTNNPQQLNIPIEHFRRISEEVGYTVDFSRFMSDDLRNSDPNRLVDYFVPGYTEDRRERIATENDEQNRGWDWGNIGIIAIAIIILILVFIIMIKEI